MRISTRFAAGLLLPLGLLVAALTYNISQMGRLADLHRDLGAVDLEATTLSLELGRLLVGLDEFARKLAVTGDPEYAERTAALARSFDERLAQLERLELEPAVRREVDELAALWRRTSAQLGGGGVDHAASEAGVAAETNRLRRRSEAVTAANQEAIAARAAQAVAAARRAQTLAWLVAAAAVAAGALMVFWSISSLRGAIHRLTAGTRSVAEGELSVRIDPGGADEFATVRSSFNEMVRRLSEREAEKKDFVTKLSHDLRTPLAAVTETTRLLLREEAGPIAPEQRRLLELNLEASTRTSGMVSKLLQMARMEARSTRYEIGTYDLAEIARQACSAFSPRASEGGHRFAVEAPEPPEDTIRAVCDRERILQLLGNLIENALKFAPSDSAIVVRVRAGGAEEVSGSPATHPGETVVIEVVDSGPGVPDEEKGRIFDKYHQVARHQKAGQGIGLGLAICREIALAHRGQISVRDNPDGGSIFSLALPAAEGPARLARSTG